MRILVSNDDGVQAIGIITLVNELKKIAMIEVFAPDRNCSGLSNALSIQNPMKVQHLSNGYYSVSGTPADCILLALTGPFKSEYDLVVSGINSGANLGYDILYSGTVAAAIDGAIFGITSIAVSLAGDPPQKNYNTAALITRQIIEYCNYKPLPLGTILNVNIPDIKYENIEGFKLTKLGRRYPNKPVIEMLDPRGSPVYWIGETGPEKYVGENTDFRAIKENLVSITVIKIDMTDYSSFGCFKDWLIGLNDKSR